jgi:hypothetical protein
MVLVPVATLFTIPVPAPTVATAVLLLVHVPPVGVDTKVDVLPRHIPVVPVMAVGWGFTVTIAVLKQPVEVSVCVMTVVPALTLVTVPVVPVPDTVATLVVLLVQGPVPADVSVVGLPLQMAKVPVITAGAALTAIL